MKTFRDALQTIRQRCADAKSDAGALNDVVYGSQRLIESMATDIPALPDGRRGMLEDLRRKASEAETTHDPLIISDLITALTAFLSEEMQEQTKPDGGDPNTQDAATTSEELPISGEETPDTDAAAENPATESMTYACEACGHPNQLPDQNSPRGAQGGAMSKDTNAPGGDLTAQLEAERTKNAELSAELSRMREAAPPPAAATDKALTDQERNELQQLRTEKRTQLLEAERLTKAADALAQAAKDSGVDIDALNEVLPPVELKTFSEANWPSMIRMAVRSVPPAPTGFASTGEISMPAPRQNHTVKREAGGLFRERFGGTAVPKDKDAA